MDINFVRDVLVEFLDNGKRFSTSDIIVACSEKANMPKQEAIKHWDDIRACVRDMRSEFMDAEEFCDSMGMPHAIQRYTRTKLEVPFCGEPVNVYHPDGWHAEGYEFPDLQKYAAALPQEKTEEQIVEGFHKLVEAAESEPALLEELRPGVDGSIIIPGHLVERIANPDSPEPLIRLIVAKGLFGVYEIYG